jgi:uncharacterized protein
MNFSRRDFLRSTGMVIAGFAGLRNYCSSFASVRGPVVELISDPDRILDLPEGFSYQIISRAGERMSDDFFVPGKHDGMCAYPGPDGRTILIRNHELDPSQINLGPFGVGNFLLERIDRTKMYDGGKGRRPGLGGTTTLVYDTRSRKLEKHFLSLAGTHRNCAGGLTPWNSWITCEETVVTRGGDNEQDHGYNFEVPATAEISLADPVPLKAMGRFNHEAVAVEPRSGIVYQTEDRGDGLFYRFIPEKAGELAAGGRLQALRIRGMAGADTRNWGDRKLAERDQVDVEWVDLEDVESPEDDLRYQGRFGQGAARFARGEGIWHSPQGIFFACTNGGSKKLGQIFRYYPSPFEGAGMEDREPGRLELFLEPNDSNLVENADNLTIAPWGDIIICEDGSNPQYLVGVTPEGAIYRFARTDHSEFAGATFSPDGEILFVNIQTPGLTMAITGPWDRLSG